MLKRIALMTALLVAPLALSPDSVDAQQRGMEQAAAASANAQANGRPDALPAGMQNRPSGQALPPGIMMTRDPAPAVEPAPEPEPEEPAEEPDECIPTFEIINGVLTPVDCDGNPIG